MTTPATHSLRRRLSFSRQVVEAIPAGPKEVVDRDSCFGRQRTSIHELRLLPTDDVHAVRHPRRLKKGWSSVSKRSRCHQTRAFSYVS